MSYRIFGGVHDILSSISDLKALGPNQREKGQIIAVKDGDYRVYIWDPTATAKELLCSLASEDPGQISWPSKASTWYPQSTPSVFEERIHMIEEDGVRTDWAGNALREDFSYLFVVPNDIINLSGGTADYTNIPGRWVVMNYATLIDNIPWDFKSGHMIPRYNDTFDFGNAEHKIRDFYLSDQTMWMGDDHKISINQTGQLQFLKRKRGKFPEHLDTHATGQHGGNPALAKKIILQAIKDDTEISAPEVDSLPSITEATDIPADLNLKLKDWMRIAIASGFTNPSPSSMFGDSDFDDALTLSDSDHSHSDGGLSGKVAVIEGMFDGTGKLLPQHAHDDLLNSNVPQVDLTPYFRDADFDTRFDGRFNGKDVIDTGGFGTLWDNRFNNDFDSRFSTKDAIIGNTEWNDMKYKFDSSGKLKPAFADDALLNSNVAGPDLSLYAKTTDLPDTTGFVTKGADFTTQWSKATSGLLTIEAEDDGQMILSVGGTQINATNSTWLTKNGTIAALQSSIDLKAGITDMNAALNGKQNTADMGAYLTTSSDLPASKITGTVAASKISTSIARTSAIPDTSGFATHSDLVHVEGGLTNLLGKVYNKGDSKVSYTALGGGTTQTVAAFGAMGGDGTITDWTTGKADTAAASAMDSRGLTSTGLTNLVNSSMNSRGLTSTGLTNLINANSNVQSGVTARGYFNSSGNLDMNHMNHTLFGNDGDFRGTLHSSAKLADGTTSINSKISSFTTNINSLQTAVTSIDSSKSFVSMPLYSFPTSDKDLKNIIRIVPEHEITSDYALIGLTVVEYEWNQIANDLFGLTGHVTEGFIAEQLEQLYPAPDPQNPPTSKDDGHVWWHEYMTDDQKELSDGVHNYYTFFNSVMLQELIDAAKA